MQFVVQKNVTPENKIVWLCGKQSQLTLKLRDDIKLLIAGDYYSDGKLISDYRENLIQINKNTSQVELDEAFKEPPFLGDKYLLLGDLSDLENKVKRRLLKLLGGECKHVVSILFISNYRDYKQLADDKKFDIGKAIYLFRISYELYRDYARSVIKKEISDKALNIYIRRTDNYSNFVLYLDKLKTLPSPITSDVIKKEIPSCSQYTMEDYLKTLILKDKKTVHIKALNACLSQYRRKTYDEIMNSLKAMLDIKKLTLRGYLLPITASEDLAFLEDKQMLPESIQKFSISKIRNYLELTSAISLTELHLIYLSFLNTRPTTQNLFILTDIIYNRQETRQLLGSICNRTLKL